MNTGTLVSFKFIHVLCTFAVGSAASARGVKAIIAVQAMPGTNLTRETGTLSSTSLVFSAKRQQMVQPFGGPMYRNPSKRSVPSSRASRNSAREASSTAITVVRARRTNSYTSHFGYVA